MNENNNNYDSNTKLGLIITIINWLTIDKNTTLD